VHRFAVALERGAEDLDQSADELRTSGDYQSAHREGEHRRVDCGWHHLPPFFASFSACAMIARSTQVRMNTPAESDACFAASYVSSDTGTLMYRCFDLCLYAID
jgi:hypothetical protein